ncbi:MAG: hypothetical protein E6Q97_36025 [Desulfurellales bacterium]|nr:MAG: hypothetical protein E6Q97_36025 [Desulfurellales bacterium]
MSTTRPVKLLFRPRGEGAGDLVALHLEELEDGSCVVSRISPVWEFPDSLEPVKNLAIALRTISFMLGPREWDVEVG